MSGRVSGSGHHIATYAGKNDLRSEGTDKQPHQPADDLQSLVA